MRRDGRRVSRENDSRGERQEEDSGRDHCWFYQVGDVCLLSSDGKK